MNADEGTGNAAKQDFDCGSGHSDWEDDWSSEKKKWCCRNEGRGCPSAATTDDYDCKDGLPNFKEEWSRKKISWCCKNKQLGCEGSIDVLQRFIKQQRKLEISFGQGISSHAACLLIIGCLGLVASYMMARRFSQTAIIGHTGARTYSHIPEAASLLE